MPCKPCGTRLTSFFNHDLHCSLNATYVIVHGLIDVHASDSFTLAKISKQLSFLLAFWGILLAFSKLAYSNLCVYFQLKL